MPSPLARVLIIAGSDSGGGAGVQGDIKTVTCLGGYAATAITALTAQNTQGVFGIHEVPDDFLKQQIELVLSDIGADAIKTGMLHSSAVIRTVSACLRPYRHIPLVVDPVMVAKGGSPLLQQEAIGALKSELLPYAAVMTPNTPEAELLSGIRIHSLNDMSDAAHELLKTGCRAVLLKGGHMEGPIISNLLMTADEAHWMRTPRIETQHTHGTGCTLASAIATYLAKGLPLKEAAESAQEYVAKAIAAAPGIGHGHGPLKHNFMITD